METLDTPGKRLKWARENRTSYKTASAAARAFGWPLPTYFGHENGDRNPSRNAAKRYAAAYNVDWVWILEGGSLPGTSPDMQLRTAAVHDKPETGVQIPIAADVSVPARLEMPRDLPILGTVSGGIGGLQMNGDAVDWVRRPPRLAGRSDVFGLYVEDQSMVPVYKPGSLILVERARPPSPGDDVVVELLPAGPREEWRALIKRLVSVTGKTVRLEQFNPAKELEFPRQQVASLFRVMTMADLLGV